MTDVVYLSNLTLYSTNEPTSSQPSSRSFIAKSTNYTQVLDEPAQEQTGHPYLLSLLKWSRTNVDHGELRLYPSLYLWSFDFEHYKSLFGDTITPIRELHTVQDGLRYQQLKSTLIQGFVAEIILHPAGVRAVRDGIMDQEEYDQAIKRLYPNIDMAIEKEEQKESPPAVTTAAAAAGTPSVEKKKRGRKAAQPITIASTGDVAMVDATPAASQSSIATRLRRSTRAAAAATGDADVTLSQESTSSRRGRSAATRPTSTEMAQVASSPAIETRRTSRSRTKNKDGETIVVLTKTSRVTRSRSTSESKVKEGRGKRGRSSSKKKKPGRQSTRRAASAESAAEATTTATATASSAQRKGGKVVKIVRKRKADRSPTPTHAAAAAATPADAATTATPTPLSAPILLPAGPSAASPAAATPPSIYHPSAPSVLATIVLRDLNGEAFIRVELHDPILSHANFQTTKGNVAETCKTPKEAARVHIQTNKRENRAYRSKCIVLLDGSSSDPLLLFFCLFLLLVYFSDFSWPLSPPPCRFLHSR